MDTKDLLGSIVDVAEDNGWYIGVNEKDGRICLEFSKFTPAEQDFMFGFDLGFDFTLEDFLSAFDGYIEGFDVDYESYLWIGPDGHGRNGAPYHIKDIVNDVEAAFAMAKELRKKMEEIGMDI